jgi:tetratricopeptide (TPR) repeat protein
MRRVRAGRHWQALVIVVSLLVANSGPLRAETDKREIEARADFVAGRYRPALEIFAQLYAETLNPIFLRNVARCQQNLKQAQSAIDAFQEYLRKAKSLKAEERQEIQGYIKEMQALLTSQQGAPTPPPPSLPSQPPQAPLAPVASPPPASSQVPPSQPNSPAVSPVAAPSSAAPPLSAPPPSGSTSTPGAPPGVVSPGGAPAQVDHPWRVAGIVTSAVGGALLGTGLAFGLAARNDASAVSQQYDPSKADAGKRAQTIGIVADLAGAAAIAAGVFLAVYERPGSSTTVSLSAGPVTDARSGLLLVGGTF